MTGEALSDDAHLGDAVALLDDEHVRSILVATSAEPHSPKELAEHCGLLVS